MTPATCPVIDTDFPEFTPESRFITWATTGGNVFLTGQAGTGKSYLLRQFLQQIEAVKNVAITAPTGIAALNIGGTTVHRWCGMQLGPGDNETFDQAATRLFDQPTIHNARKRVEEAEILVIDEISMMAGRQFDFLNFWLKLLRDDARPFGGLQIIVLGDFLQLPPVRIDQSKPYDWAFRSDAWAEADFKTIKLETVRRQDDRLFVQALSGFRIGKLAKTDADVLRSRVSWFPKAEITHLLTHNAQVDKWNSYRLETVTGELITIEARTKGVAQAIDFATKNMSTPRVLQIKIGAAVMFTANDAEAGFANGQIGFVTGKCGDTIDVYTRGKTISVGLRKWFFDTLGVTVWQYPLRLAYAMTIHRAQGLTLDAAYIDIRAAREPGQGYVALSRVRTLGGLHLKEWPKGWFISEEAIRFERREPLT
jgi:ATP-dependent DNA helicase PIF1